MTLRIEITGLPPERLRFAASPLAELIAMLHALAATEHHPELLVWAADLRARLRPELSERLQEADFLWRSSRADFLLPAEPRQHLTQELDDVDRVDDETYVASALVTTCGSSRVHFDASPLTDADARERALDRAQARGAVQEAFAQQLLADPSATRARVRETLEQCSEAFFDAAWPVLAARIVGDARVKTDLRERKGIGPALAAVSAAIAFTETAEGECIVVDKVQDNATSARGQGDLTSPEVSRHLAVLRKAGLLTTQRHGRYVHYTLNLQTMTTLGTDLLSAVLR